MNNRVKINIALLAGGDSSEREVSLGSAKQVCSSLDKSKYNVYTIDVNGRDWIYVSESGESSQLDRNDFSLEVDGCKITLDYALIMIHGSPGEDGKLQGYFDIMKIPYSSCDMVSSVITFDKISTKRAVWGEGIYLAKEVVVRSGDEVNVSEIIDRLGLPVFVKPNASGSSFGVTKVNNADELVPAIDKAYDESPVVLIEEYIKGREFGCGVMITAQKEYIFPITEIISKKDFFDYEAKYTAGMSEEITPADLGESAVKQLNDMTRRIYKACGCRGVVRVDFIIRQSDGQPFMIEVNTIPGMSEGSIVPKQITAMGMTMGELFDIVIAETIKTHDR